MNDELDSLEMEGKEVLVDFPELLEANIASIDLIRFCRFPNWILEEFRSQNGS